MSQSGLLSEDEVKTYINEGFNLKLDKEPFLKPSKEFVFDIYARFLDYFSLPWKKPNPVMDHESGPNLKIRMVAYTRSILSKYNTPFEFNLNDLLTPTRKRTTVFMNILIYIKAQVDEAWAQYQEDKEEWLSRQQETEHIKREINQLKLEIEDMAIAKANHKPIEELRKENTELRRHFEAIRDEGEALSNESKKIKIKIKEEAELLEKEELELKMLNKRHEDIEATLKLLNDGRRLKKNIQELQDTKKRDTERLETLKDECRKEKAHCANLGKILTLQECTKKELSKQTERVTRLFASAEQERIKMDAQLRKAEKDRVLWIQKETLLQEQITELERSKNKISIQHKIKLGQHRLELEKKVCEMEAHNQMIEAKIADLKNKIRDKRVKRAEIAAKQAAENEKSKAQIENANRRLESLRKRIQESRAITQQLIPKIIETQQRIDLLMGKPKEAELPSADRTYIKEPDRTYIKEAASDRRTQ